MSESAWEFEAHLEERWCRREGVLRHGGEFVLYWMRTAVRAHENPALDAALALAEGLNLPMLVYHCVSERHPFANDRHHTFMLEGARDVAAELAARSIPYALHVERPGHRGPHLKTLGKRAAAVVTEEMPVSPLREWTERLAKAIDAPVWSFDTACVVPMPLAGHSYTRAFKYRDAVKGSRQSRLSRDWPEQNDPLGTKAPELPFEPVDFLKESIEELVAAAEIDHTIAPVPHTVGGSQHGYQRWNQFVEHQLRNYARTRNDPLKNGVSRMSAYLHYGHVSPFRLAREAASRKADKYLDELVTWRELAYTFCYYRADIDSLDAIPEWARESLKASESDPRPALLSWESLSRANSGDPLWDACQRSLLIHGELHNNVRMTWGKALLQWTDGAEQALALLLDLNHRYALDGRDPASYGGILWCLGQFDRPFAPRQPVLGVVRPRPTGQHARRLDVEAYADLTGRPLVLNPPSVAVVGAGMAGVTCARVLNDHGIPVTLYDKGRGPGGRMSTRRSEGGASFDHGAQYFTAKSSLFMRWLGSWLDDQRVAPWRGRVARWNEGNVDASEASVPRYVATPSMSSLVAHLAGDLDVHFSAQLECIQPTKAGWKLELNGHEPAQHDLVLFGAPAPQTRTLLNAAQHDAKGIAAEQLRALCTSLDQVEYRPCWALLLELSHDFDPGWDGLSLDHLALAWIARNHSKPDRTGPPTWVAHATPTWSEEYLEYDRESAAKELTRHVRKVTGIAESAIKTARAHRWRYALVDRALDTPCLWAPELGLGACGDWAVGPRVEAAFLSGAALAGRVLGALRSRAVNQPDAARPGCAMARSETA